MSYEVSITLCLVGIALVLIYLARSLELPEDSIIKQSYLLPIKLVLFVFAIAFLMQSVAVQNEFVFQQGYNNSLILQNDSNHRLDNALKVSSLNLIRISVMLIIMLGILGMIMIFNRALLNKKNKPKEQYSSGGYQNY